MVGVIVRVRSRLTTLLVAIAAFAAAFAGVWTMARGMRAPAPPSVAPATAPSSKVLPGRSGTGPRTHSASAAIAGELVRGPYALELFESLDFDGTGRGARVREALNRATEKMYLELIDLRGRTASACAPEVIDDTVIRIRYTVRGSEHELAMENGTPPEGDFDADVHRCLEDYLRHRVVVTATEIGAPLAEIDIDVIGFLPTGDVRVRPPSR